MLACKKKKNVYRINEELSMQAKHIVILKFFSFQKTEMTGEAKATYKEVDHRAC